MKAYHYHPVTGLYLGSSEADPDPLVEGSWLLPAHSTAVAPPPIAEPQQVQLYSGGAWLLVPDLRGTDYWLADGSQHTITILGETVPAGALLTPPPPPVEEVAMKVLTEINVHCDSALSAITAGYPASEISSWDKQEQEARTYPAPTPLLAALASTRGITVADLVARVIAKADAFTLAAGTIIGQRQALEDQVTAILGNPELGDDEKRAALEAVIQ